MKGRWVRRIWSWHLWMGVALLLPLLWWTATALVFSLWPIEAVRGTTLARSGASAPERLTAGPLPPAELMAGARSLRILPLQGRVLAVADHGDRTEVWDLAGPVRLGEVLPLEFALEAARRDLAAPQAPESAYLLGREGGARRLLGQGPEHMTDPAEYAGPRPAYVLHYPGTTGLHLYVDALDGQVRARRRTIWRVYDFAFRLHSFEFTADGPKRAVQLAVCLLWLALGVTGSVMAWRRLRPSKGRHGPA